MDTTRLATRCRPRVGAVDPIAEQVVAARAVAEWLNATGPVELLDRRGFRDRLVSCAFDSLKKSSEGGDDLLGGLGPQERFGVRVPVGDPGADVGLEGLDAAVVAAA